MIFVKIGVVPGALWILAVVAPWNSSAAGEFGAVPTTIRDAIPNTDSGIISKASGPEISICTQNGGAEVLYTNSPTTIFIDESGGVISRDLIRIGQRVTVHYRQEAGRRIANRVVVAWQAGTKTIAPTIVEVRPGVQR